MSSDRELRGWFNDKITWKLGNGNKILLWENKWLGNQSLKVRYTRLFTNSTQKEVLVVDVGE